MKVSSLFPVLALSCLAFVSASVRNDSSKMYPTIFSAAANGSVEQVRKFIENGASVSKYDPDRWTPLMHAARHGHSEVIRTLVTANADVNEPGGLSKGYPMNIYPLDLAAEHGHTEAVRALIEMGADIAGWKGSRILLIAATHGRTDVAKVLIERGVDVNSADLNNNTALMKAVYADHVETAQMLIDAGADVNKPGYSKQTALIKAVMSPHLQTTDMYEMLIRHGAKLNDADSHGQTALMHAVQLGNEWAVDILLDYEADMNAADNKGWTALMHAVYLKSTRMLEMLLNAGADVRKVSKEGKDALMYARMHNMPAAKLISAHIASTAVTPSLAAASASDLSNLNEQLVSAVQNGDLTAAKGYIEAGASVNAKSRHGHHLLHYAIDGGHTEVFDMLLDKGADVNMGNGNNDAALAIAARIGRVDMIKKLLEAGAHAGRRSSDFNGRTAWDYAKQNNFKEAMNILNDAIVREFVSGKFTYDVETGSFSTR